MEEKINTIDHHWLFEVQQNRLQVLDSLFYTISLVATYVVILLILLVAFKAWRQKSKQLLYRFYFLAITEIVSALSIYALKQWVNRTRPYVTFQDIEKLGSGGGMSFPSGHTTEAFCMAWAFVLVFPNQKSYRLLFIWAVLVGYSRMILGVHYPFDVMAGMIYGSLIAWVMYLLLNKALLSQKI